VLSAVEGTEIAAPALADWVVPISCAILVALFLIQQRGTDVIARFFGPIMVVWFSVLALLGVAEILSEPGVVRAVNPIYAARFFTENGRTGFLALGAVFLVVTGGEALYADMGHFGPAPDQAGLVHDGAPGLAPQLLRAGGAAHRRSRRGGVAVLQSGPSWSLYPLIALATAATIIASQALISGVFSLTLQAIQLGYARPGTACGTPRRRPWVRSTFR
jgi:KUP system potassium uptake protein